MKSAKYTFSSEGQYFKLSRTTPWSHKVKKGLWYLIKSPFLLLHWFFSFIVTVLAVNPMGANRQREVNNVEISLNKDGAKITVINVCPPVRFKILKDFLFKIKQFLAFLGMSWFGRRPIFNLKKTEVERLIQLIKDAKHTVYLKGIEYLDQHSREQLLSAVNDRQDHDADVERPGLDFFSLETPDGAVLDSVAVKPSSWSGEEPDIAERQFIVTCLPRDLNYLQWIKDFNYSMTEAQSRGVHTTVIGFNYRGTDRSRGMLWTSDNMVNDAISQVRLLIQLGADPKHITLEGTCIGGNVATLAAARLHEEGLHVKLFNERSFRSIRRFLVGYLWPTAQDRIWHPKTWGKYFCAAVINLIVAPALLFTGWRMDAAKAWEKIPEAYKRCAMASDPAAVESIHQHDGIIEESWASMASKLKELKEEPICFRLKKRSEKQEVEIEESSSTKGKPKYLHFLRRSELEREDGISLHQDMLAFATSNIPTP